MLTYIGQHIFDFASKFRNKVYLENLKGSSGILNVADDGEVEKLPASYDIDTWHLNPDNFLDVNAPEGNPTGVTFKPDGTRVFVLGNGTSTVLQYDLSTAWDLTTAGSVTQSSNVRTLSGNLLGSSLQSMFIDSTGTRLYILSSGSDSISQYTIDTAWDISSLTFIRDIHVNSTSLGGFVTGESNPTGLTFKSDGTILYVAGYNTDKTYQVPLSTAWDISTHGTITSISTNPPGRVASINFNTDGTKFYLLDYDTDIIYEYSLSTAWDITTASLTENTYPTIARYETLVEGFYYSDTLKKAFVVGRSDDMVYEIVVDDTIKFSEPLSSPVVHTDRLHTPRINMVLDVDNQDGIRINRNNNIQFADISYNTLNFGGFHQGNIKGDYGVNFTQNQNRSSGHIWNFASGSKTITDNDGEQGYMRIAPNVNQTGTANYVGILFDVTETGTGSGTNSLMDLRVGGSSKFTVRNDGKLGIGTTSPDSLLEISSSSATDFLKLTSGGGPANPVKIIFEKSAAEQGIIEYNRNGDLEIYNSDGDGGVMLNGRNSAAGDLYVADGGNVGIGTTSPDSTALLDVSSTTKGVLFPRMTETQKNAISSPATGLIVYQTDATEGLYIYKSTGWTQIV